MDVEPLRADGVERFVDELWLPAQREMAATSPYRLAGGIRERGVDHRRSRVTEEGTVTLLARREGALAGYVSARVRTPPPIFEPVRECHVGELWVREADRREGVASALLDAVEAWARDRGCDRMDLNVDRDNRAARALYDARGYETARLNLKRPLDGDE